MFSSPELEHKSSLHLSANPQIQVEAYPMFLATQDMLKVRPLSSLRAASELYAIF
jgi:hypothetical protein